MSGFTLTELAMIVIVLAICASIALPGYRHQVIRARRAEARMALLGAQTAEEKHYLRTGRYTNDLARAPDDPGARYDLVVNVAEDGQSFVATASPSREGGQRDDTQCLNFSIDERGTRGVTGPAGPEACWK
jgi:type IV pilus assembly protein PilE